jgi:hypothetical protein
MSSKLESEFTADIMSESVHNSWLVALIVVQFLAIAVTSFTHNVNWDEFHFLQTVHEYMRGESVRAMQTFHVRLFSWIVELPVSGLTQILAGRIVALVLVLGTAALTVFLAHDLMRQGLLGKVDSMKAALAGLLAAAALLTSGFMTVHAASFRSDPVLAFLLMAALTVLFTCKTSVFWLSIAVLCASLALVISVKATLWLPAFVAALIWRSREPGVTLRMVVAGLLVLPVAGAFIWGHSLGLNSEETESSASSLSDALTTGLLSSGLVPRQAELLLWVSYTLPGLAGAAFAFSLLSRRSETRPKVRAHLTLLLIVAPVASVLIYRNAFPYFFPFISPPLMVAAGMGLAQMSGKTVKFLILPIMAVSVVGQGVRSVGESNEYQRMTIDALRRMFPTPVAYIERSAALPDYQKLGPFLSGWGLQKYREASIPVFATQITRRQPPFVLATSLELLAALEGRHSAKSGLLLDDQIALSQNYVHFSGPVWLAGKKVTVGHEPIATTLLIGGRYRLESEEAVIVNGQRLTPGEAVNLLPGPLTMAKGTAQQTEVILILDVPEEERKNIPGGAFYASF